MKRFSVIVIGTGGRGWSYSKVMRALPEKFKIVGVADPLNDRLEVFPKAFKLPEDALFTDWHDILNKPKMADVAIIAPWMICITSLP